MRRVLIYGAGEAGRMVLGEIKKHPLEGIVIFGFIDDDARKLGKVIGGVKVLGGKNHLLGAIRTFDISEVIIAMPSIPKAVIKDVVRICKSEKVKLLIVPSTMEIIAGSVRFDQIKVLDLVDLLDREEVTVNVKEIKGYIEGKRVLVTGGAGSIGSELVMESLGYGPSLLVSLDMSENALFYLQQRVLQSSGLARTRFVPCVADIKDEQTLHELFCLYEPEVVFHAAAYKHVPLMEFHQRTVFLNNVIGTRNLLEMAELCGVERFVGISTDKAVRPLSVMGKTKRICELMIGAYARRGLRCSSVRFGNVLGSNGSVVTVFQEQIRRGGPLTITSPLVERFFMTIREAVALLLQAGSYEGKGDVYVLEMGEPIKIKDLAENMIILSGMTPGTDIRINYTGLREGEKLHEELVNSGTEVMQSSHKSIFIEKNSGDFRNILERVNILAASIYEIKVEQVSGAMDRILESCSLAPAL